MPTAKVVKRRLRFSFVWVVPLVALGIAGYLVYQHARAFGPTISIHFRDAAGIRPGRTIVQYRGAEVGKVDSVALTGDHQYAVVKIKLRREVNSLAREGSAFWIVSPQLGLGNITGLGTIVSGAYIEVSPGDGPPQKEFIGVENSPRMIDPKGRLVILRTDHGGSLRAGVPIYYRGVEVGAVKETRLSADASAVEIHGVIRERFAPLVTSESKFWNVTGMDMRVGLFRGAEINVESLKSLLLGGIAFATPERANSRPAPDRMIFRLYDEADKSWLKWSPSIQLAPEPAPPY
ncbi:MAG TPA: MlaD family protein [Verrucomicrobiae bacterium]|nr:MlaD family protein [Verrucomicrobiae bacterium]